MESTSYSITFDRDSGLTMKDLPGDDCKKMLLAAIDLIEACADGDVYSLQSIENNCIKLTFGFSPETRKKVLASLMGLALITVGPVRKAVVEFDRALSKLTNVSVFFVGASAKESFKLEPGERLQERMQKLVMPKPFLTSIYGEVLQVGGESPNVHLKVTVGGGLTSGQTVICECSKETVREAAKVMYEEVGFSGLLDTPPEGTPRMKKCTLLPYRAGKNGFAALRQSGLGEAFRNVYVDEYLAEIRGV